MNTNSLVSKKLDNLVENEHLIREYAKRRCRRCNGKGIIHREVPNLMGQFRQSREICSCVVKNVRKEFDETELG